MSNLFVVAYDDLATADQVRDKLLELSKQHLVELEDAVVVERRDDGRIKLHQAVDHTAVGAAGGAVWGGVIGLLFLAPLLGAAVGAAAGGAFTDTGIDDRICAPARRRSWCRPRSGRPRRTICGRRSPRRSGRVRGARPLPPERLIEWGYG
jgi:uncharacterized membrane protein